jgi:alkylation response protein AidB-like acyl-CoA dehydrogenase
VAALADAGLLLPDAGIDLDEVVAVHEELGYHRAPCRVALAAATLFGPAIARFGSPDQRQRFLPRLARGELRFYLGYSEPEVGSDLASLSTRAERDGDEWVITGQKSWGTGAHVAEWVWLAARTDPAAARPHDGITVFLFPTGLPGWEAQPHRALSGEVSCSTFFDGVRVPDSARVGDVNGGWAVITSALAGERLVMAAHSAEIRRQFDDLLAIVRAAPALAGPPGSAQRARWSALAARLQMARLLLRAGFGAVAGGAVEVPMAKVVTGDLAEEFGEAALELLGPGAALAGDQPGTVGDGHFEFGLRLAPMYVIGGGTADIQRNLIARALGLPRSG